MGFWDVLSDTAMACCSRAAQPISVNFSGNGSREETASERMQPSVLFRLHFRPGTQRRPERSVEQAAILARIDIGNMRGVAEIGLPVPNQIAIALLADDGLRVHHNEMRIVPVPIEDAGDLVPEGAHRKPGTGLDLPFADGLARADL